MSDDKVQSDSDIYIYNLQITTDTHYISAFSGNLRMILADQHFAFQLCCWCLGMEDICTGICTEGPAFWCGYI